MQKKCQNCDMFFKTKSVTRKFCSQKCFRAWRKGKTYIDLYGEEKTLEIKEQQSRSNLESGSYKHGKQFQKGHTTNNGKAPWNKGLVGVQEAWNKGLTMKNYFDEEQYKRFIDGCVRGGVSCCLKMSSNKERTKIELLLEELLGEAGIKFFVQYPLLGITVADAYLPDNHVAIYADGNYWHNYPHGTKKDHEVTKELNNANIRVLRFWESDFVNNIDEIKNKIRELQRL